MGSKSVANRVLAPLFAPGMRYAEPFGGGASMLFKRFGGRYDFVPTGEEFYNDIAEPIVNYFTALRDEAEALIAHIPAVSTKEVWEAQNAKRLDASLPSPERAAAELFCRIESFLGAGSGYVRYKKPIHPGTFARFCASISHDPERLAAFVESFYELNGLYVMKNDDPTNRYYEYKLQSIHNNTRAASRRIRNVRISNLDWAAFIDIVDAPGTQLFIDPPYPATNQKGYYSNEFTAEHLTKLLHRLDSLQSEWVVCGYSHPALTDWLNGIEQDTFVVEKGCHNVNSKNSMFYMPKEYYIMNFNPQEALQRTAHLWANGHFQAGESIFATAI